jgi:hypothetical protein
MEATSSGLSGVPWMSSQSVVRASLESLDRGGPVVCVPGLGYKVLVRLIRLTPRRVLGWAAAMRRRAM